MVEKVKIDKWVFLKTGIITALIFIAGLFIGYYLDTSRSNFLENEILSLSVESESFTTSQLYLENNPNYCNITESRIHQIAKTVDNLGQDLASLEGKISFVNTTYIDRRYFIYEIRFWLLAEEYKVRCGKNLTTILFFYGDDNQNSYDEGLVITAMKDEFGNKILVFSFKENFDEPAVELIKQDYGISTTPTLIINKKKYEGFIDKDQLRDIILSQT